MLPELVPILSAGDWVSGEEMARRLGVSRVAIWKAIQRLKEKGYEIESGRRGYRLKEIPDRLYPELFSDLPYPLFHYEEVESTMEVARELAQKGLEGVVVAERQKRGRGRLGRSWLSPQGGLYFTLILRPNCLPSEVQLFSLAFGVVVARAIEGLYHLPVALKWPNDVLYQGRKVCGILLELSAEADGVRFVLVGVGVNVNHPIKELEPRGISLKEILGKDLPRRALLWEILREWKVLQDKLSPEEVITEWQKRSDTLGRWVRVSTPEGVLQGRAFRVDSEGALWLETSQGPIRVLAGDCHYLRPGEET